jgi:hypothetical protein
MNHRENYLRAYRFQGPDWIPVASGFSSMMWEHYPARELEALFASHPILFPGYKPGDPRENRVEGRPDLIAGVPYRDFWGCVWETAYTGMVGHVRNHPLADLDALAGFAPPDPARSDGLLPLDWNALREGISAAKAADGLTGLYLPHGHTFLRLQDLIGFETLAYALMDDDPRLWPVITMIEAFNLELVRRFVALEPDVIGIPEDLGAQDRLMISPRAFRKYIKPSYLRLTGYIKGRGILIHEHSDGHILQIIDDLVEAGGDVLNLQDLVNGIDNIAREVKGRVAIELDIDRQSITVEGSTKDIDDHIRECVAKLNTPAGGLGLVYQPWPPTPIENIRAVWDALEKYCVTNG